MIKADSRVSQRHPTEAGQRQLQGDAKSKTDVLTNVCEDLGGTEERTENRWPSKQFLKSVSAAPAAVPCSAVQRGRCVRRLGAGYLRDGL